MVHDDLGNGEPMTQSPADPRDRTADPEAEIARLTALLQDTQKQLDAKVAERTAALQVTNLELARSSHAKSEFLARMSHDLRQPLNAIVGFTDLLLMTEGEPLSPKQRRHLGHVAAASRQLLGLINDLRDLSRVESGRMEIHPEPCDVAALLEETLALFRTQTQDGRVSLVLEMTSPLSRLLADRVRVQQVLHNLLSNAFKFTPEGGFITVTAKQVGLELEVAVRDTGVGIPLEDQKRIFEAYEQAGPKEGQQKGVGLGLAIARRLVELHGGRIWVESAPGQGSTFTFRLPGACQVETGQVARDGSPLVLVIEDDMLTAGLIRTQLMEGGYRVALVASGHAGLGAAKRLLPQVITLDLGLPDLDGWEVLYRLKNDPATQGIPVLVVTAQDQGQLGPSLGAVDWLTKPVDSKRLLTALRRCQALGAPRRPLCILIVDDEATVLEALEALLTREGHRIIRASDGQSALKRAAADLPDIVLLDLHLPDVSGLEVVTRLRQIPGLESVSVIAFSGKFVSPEERTLLTQQAVQFVGKYGAVGIQQLLGDLRRISSLAN
ncbi:MAG: response regulator [candidate division NC10 bacterium]|nr:response regulator [candidate division NC10 bacterium]